MLWFLLFLFLGSRSKKVEKYVARQFRNPTGLGGKLSGTIMNYLNKAQYKSLIEQIRLSKEDKVLDIGFGNGYLLSRIAKGRKGTFWGIDLSNDMLKNASERNKKLIGKKRLELLHANVEKMPFESDFFNKIYTVNTIYFWRYPEKCFTEIARVLKPDGFFLNVMYDKQWLDKISYTKHGFKKYKPDELVKLAQKSGLDFFQIIEIKKDVAYCMIAKRVSD